MPAKEVKTAVALRYPEWADAPFITASAQGLAAQKLVTFAAEHNIPVVENQSLAQVLSLQRIGTYVPEETWQVVAKIFAFVIEMQNENE
ncbi:MAG: EscU/YscU/HrcU family type III secretion system export apparatus switch protein [Treponema sp.]|nr:EscU/YscU/HrcU family type III secretion system export apparatus switch protein [Treponema sp.]